VIHRGPSISAVIPTYNDAPRIPDAIESILSQTHPPLEIIVSDDGSDDGTEIVVARLASRQQAVPIRYSRLASRSGVVAARNNGIRLARGDWIANCDSDDYWGPTKLQRQVEFLEGWQGSAIALLGTHGFNVNNRRRVISNATMGPTTEAEYRKIQDNGDIFYMLHSSTIFPRAAYEKVGGYTLEYGLADDVHFWTRIAGEGAVIVVPERLVYYRKRAGSIQLARFTDQQLGTARLVENRRRERAGLPPVDAETFASQRADAPAIVRLRERRHLAGMYYYRAGAARLVNGEQLRGAWNLLLASCLDGSRVRSGLKGTIVHAARRPLAIVKVGGKPRVNQPQERDG